MLGFTRRTMDKVPQMFKQVTKFFSKRVETQKPFEKFVNEQKKKLNLPNLQKENNRAPNLEEQKRVIPNLRFHDKQKLPTTDLHEQKPITFNLKKLSNSNVKTSMPIMASYIDVMKTVKPHIQSIKFPARGAQDLKPPAAQHFGVSNTVESLLTKPSQPSAALGNKGPAIESSELPLKYRRKPLSPEEMECIEKGGQV